MGNLQIASLLANSKYAQLKDKYGKAKDWRIAASASILAADLSEGYNKYANAEINKAAIEHRQKEVSERADMSLFAIEQKSKAVQALQATAFIKSGVKLEGSAINVLTETAVKAAEAKKARQREADFDDRQMEVQKSLQDIRSKFAGVNTLLKASREMLSLASDLKYIDKLEEKKLERITSLTMGVE